MRIAAVLRHGLAVFHFGFGVVLVAIELVAGAYVVPVVLCEGQCGRNEQQQHGCTLLRTKEMDVAPLWVFDVEDEYFGYEQDDNDDAHGLELLAIFAVNHGLRVCPLQLGQLVVQFFLCIVGVVHVYIDAVSSLRNLLTHAFVQCGEHRLSAAVG